MYMSTVPRCLPFSSSQMTKPVPQEVKPQNIVIHVKKAINVS